MKAKLENSMQWHDDMTTCPKVPGKPLLIRVNGSPRLVSWVEADVIFDAPGWYELLSGDTYSRVKEHPDAWAPVP